MINSGVQQAVQGIQLEVYADIRDKYSLSLSAQPDAQGFFTVELTHPNGQTQPLGKARPVDGSSLGIRFFHGKGGSCAIVESGAWGGKYFALPGSTLEFKDGTAIELFEDPAAPKARPLPAGAAKPQPATQSVTEQAFILGAGIGSRILPITDETGYAKPALPLDGEQTVIGRIVDVLKAAGIKRLIINISHLKESVVQALENTPGIDIHFIEESRATGTAGALWQILREQPAWFRQDQPLLVVQGDSVTDMDFATLLNHHQAQHAALTIGCQQVPEEDVNKFGIIATDRSGEDGVSGRITEFYEKPDPSETPHRLGSTGFYILAPEVFPMVLDIYDAMKADGAPMDTDDRLKEFDFAKHIFAALLARTKADGIRDLRGQEMPMWAQKVSCYWSDIGNPYQYLVSLREVYAGHLGFEPPANLQNYYAGPNGALYWPQTKQNADEETLRLTGNLIITRPFQT